MGAVTERRDPGSVRASGGKGIKMRARGATRCTRSARQQIRTGRAIPGFGSKRGTRVAPPRAAGPERRTGMGVAEPQQSLCCYSFSCPAST